MIGGRLHAPALTATVTPAPGSGGAGGAGDDELAVHAPGVGLWRPLVTIGDAVRAGDVVGQLEILGATYRVIAGPGARGLVRVAHGAARAHTPVDHGAVLLVLDPSAGIAAAAGGEAAAASGAATGLVLCAPSSGRFYGRPAPGKPAFVSVGEVVKVGQTVCMLEVMKTFHRVTYGGSGLPEEARVIAIAIADESDVNPGDVLLRLEALT